MATFTHEPIGHADRSIKPMMSFVLYGSGNNYSHITKHVVTNGELGLGRIIHPKTLLSHLNKLEAEPSCLDILPANVLLNSTDYLIWHKSSIVAPMWFRTPSKVSDYNVKWPPLLFCVNKITQSLQVFATATNKRPTESTRLYHAPLMNIDNAGDVCLGSAVLPNKIDFSTIDEIEKVITETQFTHTNHDETLRGGASNPQHMNFWKARHNTQARVKSSDLTFYLTLSSFLKGLHDDNI